MSRCFPFPPPGFEKKPRSDQEDSLVKEKRKEKKDRKEKRDKEKEEGKERKERDKDKDRSKDKHREKKDKHRDKDRKKHKDRDKDRKKILNEGKSEAHTESQNERNLGEGSCEAVYLKDPKFNEQLGKRIRNENGAGNPVGKKITDKVQRPFKSTDISAEKESTHNKMVTGNKMVPSITIPDQRMGMAGKMEDRGTMDEMLQNPTCEDQRRVNGMGRPMGQDVHKKTEGKKRTKEQAVDLNGMGRAMGQDVHKKTEGKEPTKEQAVDVNGMGRAMGQDVHKKTEGKERAKEPAVDVNGMGRPMGQDAHKKTEGKERDKEQAVDVNWMARPMGQNVHKKIEGKERTKVQAVVDGHKDRVQDKVHKEKNKERNDEKKKEKEKTREKGEHKHIEQDKPRDIPKKEKENSLNIRPLFIPEDKQKSACADGSLKRKQINGFLHESEMRCNKLPRPSSSSTPPFENGRKLDQSLIDSPCASVSHEAMNLMKVETVVHKKNKLNGVIDIRPPSTILGPPLISDTIENGKSFKRPPHPDEKYLSQILHVPKMEEWPEFDDQDWLLSGDSIRKNPKPLHNADETPQVWASALQIGTSDVLALPYVIPY